MLSPILLSFLLIILTFGGRTVWIAVGPLTQAVSVLSEKLPAYTERLQKPLIKMEQQGVISEDKLQKEVGEEIARETPDIDIVHEELFRKRFLPSVTNDDLDRLARSALLEKVIVGGGSVVEKMVGDTSRINLPLDSCAVPAAVAER